MTSVDKRRLRQVGAGTALAAAMLFASPCFDAGASAATSDKPGAQPDLAGESINPGGSLAGQFLAARFAESVGDFPAAAEFTNRLLEERPADLDIVARGHLLMLGAGRFREAVVLAERIVAADPDQPIANMTLAIRDIGTGAFDTALGRLDKFEASGLNKITVPLMRAWALFGSKKTDEALAVLEPLNAPDSLGPVSGLHAGLIAALAERDEAAGRNFERAIRFSGGSPALQLVQAYAVFLADSGRIEEARPLVTGYAAKNPQLLLVAPIVEALEDNEVPPPVARTPQEGVAVALHAVANLLGREQLGAQAQLLVRFALHLKPGDASSLYLLGQLLESQQLHDDAIAVYREIDPETPYGWYAKLNIADTLRTTERTDEAIRLLRNAMRERTGRADAARALGDLLRFEKRYREAIDVYDEAFERAGESLGWQFYYVRGIALERAKIWNRAEKDFLKALDMEPDQPLVLNYLGYSWVEQGTNLDRAREMIEKAVAKRPQDGYITDSLGWILYRMGDYEASVGHMERAVALEPGDPVINDHLGDVYWIVGRRHEARFQWLRALSQEPDADVAEKIRAKLEGRELPKPLPPGKRQDI